MLILQKSRSPVIVTISSMSVPIYSQPFLRWTNEYRKNNHIDTRIRRPS